MMPSAAQVLVALNVVALGAALALAAGPLRHRTHPVRGPLLPLLLAILASGLVMTLVHPWDLPLDWLNILHEGRTVQHITALGGASGHSGPSFGALTAFLADGPVRGLRDTVRLNLALAAGNAVLFACFAFRTLGPSWRSLLMLALFVGNGATFQSMLSEAPSQLLGTYFLVAVTLLQAARAGGGPRRNGLGLLVTIELLILLAALTRPETLAISLPAFLMLALEDERCAARRAALAKALADLRDRWRRLSTRLQWLLGLATLSLYLALPLLIDSQFRWAVDAVQPMGLVQLLTAPTSLAEWSTLGLMVLFLLGLYRSLLHPRQTLGLGYGLAFLMSVYLQASNNHFFEVFRYFSMLMAPVLVIATRGWSVFDRFFATLRHGRLLKVAASAAILASLHVATPQGRILFRPEMKPLDQPLHMLPPTEEEYLANPLPWFRAPVQRDHQFVMRHLLGLVEEFPGCQMVTLARRGRSVEDRSGIWDYVFFSHGQPWPRVVERDGMSVEEAVERHLPDAPCVMFYAGLSCNVAWDNPCADEVAVRQPLRVETTPIRPYNDPASYGFILPVVTLGLYAVEGHRPPPTLAGP